MPDAAELAEAEAGAEAGAEAEPEAGAGAVTREKVALELRNLRTTSMARQDGRGGESARGVWQPPLRARQMVVNETQIRRENFLKQLKYLDIGISIKGLQSTDLMSFIDPCVVAWIPDEKGTGWREYMRTEVMFDAPEPRFATWLTVKLDPYRQQLMKFVLYDWEDSRKTAVHDQEPIAQIIIDVSDIALAGTSMRFRKPLQPAEKMSPIDFKRSPFDDHGLGVISLVGVPSEVDSHKSRWVRLHIGTRSLLREHVHGRDKFWIEVSRWSDGEFDIVYRTEEASRQDQMFRSFALSLPRVCYNQLENDIRFDVMHRTATGVISRPKLIGQTVISLAALLDKMNESYEKDYLQVEVEEPLSRSQSNGVVIFRLARIYTPSNDGIEMTADEARAEAVRRQLQHPTTGATMPPTPSLCALMSNILRERETVVPPVLLTAMGVTDGDDDQTPRARGRARPASQGSSRSGALTSRGRLESSKPGSAPSGDQKEVVKPVIHRLWKQENRTPKVSMYSNIKSKYAGASPRPPSSARSVITNPSRPHTPRLGDFAKGSLPENNPLSKDCQYLQRFLATRDGVQTPHLTSVVSECLWFIQESRVASMEDWKELKDAEKIRHKSCLNKSRELREEFTNFHKQLKMVLKETSRDADRLGHNWKQWTRPEPVCKPPPPPKTLRAKAPKKNVLETGYTFKTSDHERNEFLKSGKSLAPSGGSGGRRTSVSARSSERAVGAIVKQSMEPGNPDLAIPDPKPPESPRTAGTRWAFAMHAKRKMRPCDMTWQGVVNALTSSSTTPGTRPKASDRRRQADASENIKSLVSDQVVESRGSQSAL